MLLCNKAIEKNCSPLFFCSLVTFAVFIGCKPDEAPSSIENGPANSKEVLKVDSVLDRVLVIENTNSPTSVQIAKYYMEKRGLKKVLQVSCPDSSLDVANESLEFSVFQTSIEKPLRAYLANDSKIDYIVLNKGIPIRLTGAPVGFGNNRPSLDSYLAALDYFDKPEVLKVVIDEGGYLGKCFVNRFWNSNERFSHAKHGGYLVTRLDGYTTASALALVDNAVASEKTKPTGTIFLDSMPLVEPIDASRIPLSPVKNGQTDMEVISGLGFAEWNLDLFAASEGLAKRGIPVELERTEKFEGQRVGLTGYASWGSNDAKFVAENYLSIRFVPGAIAETAVSTSGRTFLPSSGGQSLIADLIEARVTGVKGYCDEPFLPAIASPTILFDRYTRGWNLAESFYAASRFVGWEDIVIGDPLCAPYSR